MLTLLRTHAEYAKANPGESYAGLTINAFGVGSPVEINDRQFNQIDQITGVVSVDTVTRAGAKGRFLTQESLGRMGRKTGKQAGSPWRLRAVP